MGYLILLLIAIGGVWLAISALKDMTSTGNQHKDDTSAENANETEVTSLAETENKEVHYHIKGDVHVAGDLHLNGDILTDSSSKSSALTLKK